MAPQIWLVTGTSSGLGTAFVQALLARGEKVIATARNTDRIAHLKDLGAAIMQLDVTASREELDRKTQEAIAIYGGLDVLVNNAGYVQFGTIEETSDEDWLIQFQTNVFGTLNLTRSFLPYMRNKKAGTIVFIGSMVAWTGIPYVGTYCSSKGAIHYAVEALTAEVAPIGIKTLLVEPGTFRTDFLLETNKKVAPSYIADYKEVSAAQNAYFEALDGNQFGDPRKGADRVIDVVKGENGAVGKTWPASLALGRDAVDTIRKKCEDTLRELSEWEALSRSTDC